MPTDLHNRKLSLRFQLIDTDGNGYVEQADYDTMAMELAAAFGHQPDSPQALQVRDRYLMLWRALRSRADADGDERITRQEFVDSILDIIVERADGFNRHIAPIAQSILDMADLDGDDRLTEAEFRTLFGVWGVPDSDAGEAFDMLDGKGSGYLERAELVSAIQEFYCSPDPDARGNWIYGRF